MTVKTSFTHKNKQKKHQAMSKQGSYRKMTKVSQLNGDAKTDLVFSLPELRSTPAPLKIALIKNGLSKANLDEIKNEAALDYNTLSAILSVSRAKLLGKKKNEKFDSTTSERIMLLGEVIAYGKSVFEDDERFHTWLRKPSRALGGQTPLQFMDTVYGLEEVKKELGRIEYGVF